MSRMMDEILKSQPEIHAARDAGDSDEILHLVDQAVIRAEEDAIEDLDLFLWACREMGTPEAFERASGIIGAARVLGLDITNVHYLNHDGTLADGFPSYEYSVGVENYTQLDTYKVGVCVTLIPETREAYFTHCIDFPNHFYTVDSGFISFDGLPEHIRNCLYSGIDTLAETAVKVGIPFNAVEWDKNHQTTTKAQKDLERIIREEY